MRTKELVSLAMDLSGAAKFARTALDVSGARAPRLLAHYMALSYLNRTSRERPIRSLPQRAHTDRVDGHTTRADVVIPVYNNFEDTQRLLEALRLDASEIERIIIVHDASTDIRVLPMLRAYCDSVANAVLVENEHNLGFVGTCNRGMALSSNDLVILNTDIELPAGAVARLIKTLRSAPDIATVTPLSNHAYGAGVPHLNYCNDRPFSASTHAIDQAFRSLGGLEPIDVPRGVGFCMAVSRDVRVKLGGFSSEFGQGYGEEADFCMRARSLGYRNVIAPDVYVYHAGGSSFGGSWKTKARAGQLRFLALHPSYVALMRDYLANAPTRAVCFAGLVALARRVSGQEIQMLPVAAVSTEEGRDAPRLQTRLLSGRVEARITFRGETHSCLFASPELAQAALSLAGVDGVHPLAQSLKPLAD